MPSGWRPQPWLAPLGWAYLLLARAHHGVYDRGWRRPRGAGVPVVSVGNVTVGGTGKTPAVAWLAERLGERGLSVGIASRGYGGRRDEDPLLVAHEGAVLADAARAGDEPAMLARVSTARVVVVGRDRVEAARLAARRGAQVVLLDDGFQHRRLKRDLDIVLLDATDPFGGGRGLPAGPLREPPGSVLRAGLVLLTRASDDLLARDGALPPSACPEPLRRVLERGRGRRVPPVFASRHEPGGLVRPGGRVDPVGGLAGRRVLLVTGVARPAGVERDVRAAGAILVDHLAWPDHHPYDAEDARRIARRADETRADEVVTTEKDAVRWPEGAPRATALRVALRVPAERLVIGSVVDAVGASGRPS